MRDGEYPSRHMTGACGITEAHSDEDHERLDRITKAVHSTAVVGIAATPGAAKRVYDLPTPTVERIAGILYLSGSKGGKAAAYEAAKVILRAAR